MAAASVTHQPRRGFLFTKGKPCSKFPVNSIPISNTKFAGIHWVSARAGGTGVGHALIVAASLGQLLPVARLDLHIDDSILIPQEHVHDVFLGGDTPSTQKRCKVLRCLAPCPS